MKEKDDKKKSEFFEEKSLTMLKIIKQWTNHNDGNNFTKEEDSG